ncbi:speckle-type poz protein [Anaeramoeba flamelloides]|uniref:Speckle-type poz protein n=1 Tax=Anaeramoeba flamelloides TaxID=1746091 RepID=A0AAV7ZRV2_9EUKA|nr:speckle-type poz protein [Anaeramoeba flamelloides]
MTIGYKHSAILTNDGKVYVCGLDRNTGFGSDIKTFQQYPQFKDNKKIIKDMGSGFEYIAYLTEDNEIWASGSYSDKTNTTVLRKIISLDENSFFNRIVACDRGAIFVYKTNNSYLSQDFGKLLESGDLSDCKIKNIPVHKILIETRLGKPFDEITQYFEENLTLKEIEDLLEWVYCDDMKNAKRTNEILGYFGIHEPQKTKLLKDDLKQLLFDEETSDFTIIVKDNDEEEEYEEELHVHKFILAARSGLFKNMFQNIKEKLPNVKDYSGKSLETIELLISFLYTDKFPITADTDQEFIKEEFEDIAEYYQLNPKIPIMKIFKECSQK